MNRRKKNICFYSVNNTTIKQYLSNILTYQLDKIRVKVLLSPYDTRYDIIKDDRVELELLPTRMDQIPLNTTFPYIYKHLPRYQGHLRTLFAKLAHCSFKTLGALGFGGDFLTSFHAVYQRAFCRNECCFDGDARNPKHFVDV